jgi:hypothetical protein
MAINAISVLGDDSLSNQFAIIIPSYPGQIDPNGDNFRVTNISIPERSINTYEVHYKTQKFTKPSGKDASANEFTFEFRVDKFWNTYKGFSDWHRAIIDPVTGIQTPDFANGVSGIRVPITVQTIDSNDVPTSTGWVFDGCFPSTIPGVDFAMDNGDPIVVSITMQYITVNPMA